MRTETATTDHSPGATRLGRRYGARKLLGEGVLGPRFFADDLERNEPVILEQIGARAGVDSVDRWRAAFDRVDAALSGIARIGRVRDLVEIGPDVFVVCGLAAERTLASILEAGAPLGEDTVADYARILAETLSRAHEAGMARGGLPASAVAIGSEGPVLVDLALVCLAREAGLLPPRDDDRQRDWRDWARLVMAMATGIERAQGTRIGEKPGILGIADAQLENAVNAALEGRPPDLGAALAPAGATSPPGIRRGRRSRHWIPALGMAAAAVAVLALAVRLVLPPSPVAATSTETGGTPVADRVEASPGRPGDMPLNDLDAAELPEALRTSIPLRPGPTMSSGPGDPDDAPEAPVGGSAAAIAAGLDEGTVAPSPGDGLAASPGDRIRETRASAEEAFRPPVVPDPEDGWGDAEGQAAWGDAADLIRQGAAEAALRATADLLAEHPTDTGAWHIRACALIGAGDPATGARLLRAVLDFDPSVALAWYNLGVARLNLGDRDGAARAFAAFSQYADTPAHSDLQRRIDSSPIGASR